MSLMVASLLGLISLFALAQITTFVFKITRNRFYAPFHFAGGLLLAIFFFSLFGSYTFALLATLGTGVLWEVYEYLLWKFVLKKKKFKPERKDTVQDIVLDFLGGVTAVAILLIFLQ